MNFDRHAQLGLASMALALLSGACRSISFENAAAGSGGAGGAATTSATLTGGSATSTASGSGGTEATGGSGGGGGGFNGCANLGGAGGGTGGGVGGGATALVPKWIEAGHNHTCVLMDDRRVYCWGEGGNFGTVSLTAKPQPVVVEAVANMVSRNGTLCVMMAEETSEGMSTVNCFGELEGLSVPNVPTNSQLYLFDDNGPKLGVYDGARVGPELHVYDENMPGLSNVIGLPTGSKVAASYGNVCWVAGSALHCRNGIPVSHLLGGVDFFNVWTGDGFVCAHGGSEFLCSGATCTNKQCGDLELNSVFTTANLVPALVALGSAHTCFVRSDEQGKVQCWGAGGKGQLGTLTSPNGHKGAVDFGGEAAAVQGLTAGDAHTCAIVLRPSGGTKTRTVQCWGDNSKSQLGLDCDGWSATPVTVRF